MTQYPGVNPPSLSARELGTNGMRVLYQLAELRPNRSARTEIITLVRFALWHAAQGEDVNLRIAQLADLGILPAGESLESVA